MAENKFINQIALPKVLEHGDPFKPQLKGKLMKQKNIIACALQTG